MREDPVAELARSLRAPLLRYAFALTGDADRAADLVQTALERFVRLSRQDQLPARPLSYLKRVIAHEHISVWRKTRRESLVDPPDKATDSTTLRGIEDADLWRALSQLGRKQRAVLVLRYAEDWDDAQIATALGCSEATVRSQASRALLRLRKQLLASRADWES